MLVEGDVADRLCGEIGDVADGLVCGQRMWRMDRFADRGCGGIGDVVAWAVSAPDVLDDGRSGSATSHEWMRFHQITSTLSGSDFTKSHPL